MTDQNALYRSWLERIINIHVEHAWTKPASDKSEAEDEWFRDRWMELTESQRKRLTGLSADLHSLRDQETPRDDLWPNLSKEEIVRESERAFNLHHWDQLLELLRRPPRFQPREMVDYLRGRAWQEMREPAVAMLFFDNADRLKPETGKYRVLSLECLKELNDIPELASRCEDYLNNPQSSPRLLICAADGFLLCGKTTNAKSFYRRGIEAVDKGIAKSSTAPKDELPAIIASAYATKSFCLEELGDFRVRWQCSDEGVMRVPETTTLLVARGLLKLQHQEPTALDDLQMALQKGTAVGWAYVEVARHQLVRSNNREALETCNLGLDRNLPTEAAAQLFEFRAIANFRLKGETELVRTALDEAIEISPLTPEFRANRLLFDRYLERPGDEPNWEWGETSAPFSELRSCLPAGSCWSVPMRVPEAQARGIAILSSLATCLRFGRVCHV